MKSHKLIYLLFAFSGMAGLIYEGTWARYLKLFLGHSSYGQILTLCIYKGGLAVGSFLAGRLLTRVKRPLRAYSLVELCVGIGGLLYHPAYLFFTEWFYNADWSRHLGSTGAEAVKLVLATASTLPVAVLLGMTFPFIAAGLSRQDKDAGEASLPLLYFTNSLGACIGILGASYILFPAIGQHGALMVAAGINFVLCGCFYGADGVTVDGNAIGHAKGHPQGVPLHQPQPGFGWCLHVSRGFLRLFMKLFGFGCFRF
jgi:predicted membrane-bound spermidine synthase